MRRDKMWYYRINEDLIGKDMIGYDKTWYDMMTYGSTTRNTCFPNIVRPSLRHDWLSSLILLGISEFQTKYTKHENMFSQVGSNFERKNRFFGDLWVQKFRNYVIFICPKNGFPPTSRWCKIFLRSTMKTNKNSCESWDIGLSNAPTLMSIRLLEKKCWAFFEKNGLLSTL